MLAEKQRTEYLAAKLDDSRRLVNLALGLRVKETGELATIVGGKYDTFSGAYVGEADHAEVLWVSEAQWKWISDPSRLVLGYGGRGSGKSHGLARWALLRVIAIPGWQLMAVSPTYKKTQILWTKILGQLPTMDWLLPGKQGVRKSARELHFINGSVIRFFSADNPDSLRGEDNDDALVDERQDIKQEAVDNILLTLRRRENYQLRQIGTPKFGTEFHDEYIRYSGDEECEVYRFSSYDNPFVARQVFEDARRTMDERTFRQEVMAEWVSDVGLAYTFNEQLNVRSLSRYVGSDITRSESQHRARVSSRFIVGVQYPNTAVVLKITSPDTIWVVDEFTSDDTNPQHLARELKKAGYAGALCVDDANARFSDQGRLASKLFRKEGFTLRHTSKRKSSPKDLMIATNAKLCSADGANTIFVSPECKNLISALKTVPLDQNGAPDKHYPGSALCRALGHATLYFYPPVDIGINQYRIAA